MKEKLQEGTGVTCERRCGSCEWHKNEDTDNGCMCVNKYSDFCGDYTDSDFSCLRWQKREEVHDLEA